MSELFAGEYKCRIDSKGRVRMPARLKALLLEVNPEMQFVINKGMENNLDFFTIDQWKKIQEKLSEKSNVKRTTRKFKRMYLRHAKEVSLDSADRFMIHPDLKKFGGIDTELIILTYEDKIELWDPDRLDADTIQAPNAMMAEMYEETFSELE